MRRTETPKPIWIKFCMVVDIPDAVTYTNFGDHRLTGFWVAGGQISPSLIDFHRRPYNTFALPCERVIDRYRVHIIKHPKTCGIGYKYVMSASACCTIRLTLAGLTGK